MATFDRAKLSERENTIIDLAIEGLTDFQISLRLGIRPSTVNSYWVRIRTKLGPLSRTELVAAALKVEAKHQLEAEQRRSQALRDTLLNAGQVVDDLARTALDFAPEAIIVLDRHGKVLLANLKAETLFGFEHEELVGKQADSLVARAPSYESLFETTNFPKDQVRNIVGMNEPVVIRRKDGKEFRAVIAISKARLDSGSMLICQCRPYLEEMYAWSHRTWPAFDLV